MTTTVETVTVTVPKAHFDEARRLAETSSRDPEELVAELLDEGIRMRHVPGIAFMDGGVGRRAHLQGTGLDIWEIIGVYKWSNWDWETLRQSFEWLTERQLRTALAYYEAYPVEIDERIHSEEEFDIEEFWAENPWSKPSWR